MLRALRMTLRELTMQLLGAKKWELFWEPEEDPEWWDKVSERLGAQAGGPGSVVVDACRCILMQGKAGWEAAPALGGRVGGQGWWAQQ